MNPKHTLNEYADALARAGLLTASTLTPAAEGTVIDCLSYDTRSLHGTSLFLCKGAHFKAEYLSAALAQGSEFLNDSNLLINFSSILFNILQQ